MVLDNMPFSEYLAHPAYNSSKLKVMIDHTPLDFKNGVEEIVDEKETRSKFLGTNVHTMLLEPVRFDRDYALQEEDYSDKRSGEEKERWDAFKLANSAKTIITKKDGADKLIALRQKVKKDASLRLFFADGKPEVTGFIDKTPSNPIALKARADLLKRDIIVDIKTTSTGVRDEDLYRYIKKFACDFQACHYLHVFNTLLGSRFSSFMWVFIDVASSAQHIRLIKMPDAMMRYAMTEYYRILDRVKECELKGAWPGYPAYTTELQMPYWAPENKQR